MNNLRPSFTEVFSTLVDFTLQPEYQEELSEASQEYFGTSKVIPQEHQQDSEYVAFVEWFVFDRSTHEGHNSFIDAFLEKTGAYSGRDRDEIENWSHSRLSFYDVVEVHPHGVLLRDLLCTPAREVFVADPPGANQLQGRELVMARLLRWEDDFHFAGAVNLFPEPARPALLEFLQEVRTNMSGDDWARVLRDVLPALSRFQTAVTIEQESLFPGGYPDHIAPQTVDTLVAHGSSCMERGEWTEALLSFQRALFADPLNITARNGVGLVHLSRGDLTAARKAFESVLETHPGNANALLNLGNVQLYVGAPGEACEYFVRAQHHSQDSTCQAYACFGLGLGLMALGEEEQAIRRFREASQLCDHPAAAADAAAINFRIGCNLQACERWELARLYFTKSMEFAPDFADARLHLAETLYTLERYREAAKHYRQAIRLNQGGGRAWHALGKCHLQLGKHAQAEYALRRALDMLPGLVEAHDLLGQAIMAQNRLEEARDRFEEALAHAPSSVDTLVRVGEVNRRLRNYKTSARYLRKALRFSPSHSAARHLLEQVKLEERAHCS